MDTQSLQTLHDLAVKTITKSFLYIKEATKQERLYGFALGISKDMKDFSCVGNTLDGVEKHFTVRLKSIEDVTDYLWFASEWDYNDKVLQENKAELQAYLKEQKISLSHIQNAKDLLSNDYFNTILQALQTCDKNGLFGIGILREKMVVFVDSVDEAYPDLSERSSQLLNPDYVHQAFLKRFDPQDAGSLTYRLISELVSEV